MNKAEDLIYELLCDIENDFENKITVDYIYQKLSEYSTQEIGKIGRGEVLED